MHKVVQSAARPDRMFLQNHWGLYRSDDRGESWTDIANGVPSDFGFAMAMHPQDPDCAWIVPLESDEFRCTPEGKLRVYRTRDAGASWEPMSAGLPQQDAYETVLRDAMAVDALEPAGVYFGTRSGKVFGSADEGETWSALADGLPPVVAVKTAVIGLMPLTFVISGPAARVGRQPRRGPRRRPGRLAAGGAVAAVERMPRRSATACVTERGEVRPHVNIFVDGGNIRHAGGLAAPVRDGAEIVILPAVSGGS